MQTLTGRTCVFSGATGGDGTAAVEALCSGGMNVVMVTHQPAQAMGLLTRINAMDLPGECTVIGATNGIPAENQKETYETIIKQYGSVDVVISNIGNSGKQQELESITSDELVNCICHLTKEAFDMTMAAFPYLKKSKAPRVILMTSVEGRHGGTKESFTNAVAKGTIQSLSVNLAARLAEYGITVNCISKGAIPRIEGAQEGFADPCTLLPFVPMQRLGTPEDLAQTICFFASEESSYITGQTISVSGGLEMG